MTTSHFGQPTLRRKLALGFAALRVIAFVVFVIPVVVGSAPSSWQPVYLILVGGFNAFAIGIAVLELVCLLLPAKLNEEKYSFWVQALFGVFFVLQTGAYLVLFNG
jgi:hypothetical protein